MAVCAAAVESDPFCEIRFFVIADVGCFCVKVGHTCTLVPSDVDDVVLDAHNRAAILLPTILHKDAYCAVGDTTTQRKLLGESLTVMACASAVAIDSFCDTKYFAREGGVCFCLPKEVTCDVQLSIDGPPIELVLKARETISHSFGSNSSSVLD
jgi:hypothetical protein